MECCEKAVKIDSQCEMAWINMGSVYGNLGKFQKAFKCFEAALRIDPQNELARENMTHTQNILKELQKKGKDINKEEDEGENTIAWGIKGDNYLKGGKIQKAIECYEAALRIDPKIEEVWTNLGIAYGKVEMFQKEIECYEAALRIDPKHVNALNNLGVAYENLGNFQKAVECYEAVLRINPLDAEVWANLGIAYGKFGKFQKEIECYKTALRIEPRADLYNNLGVAYINLGNLQEALESFEEALRIDPQNEPIRRNLIRIHEMQGQLQEGEENVEEELEETEEEEKIEIEIDFTAQFKDAMRNWNTPKQDVEKIKRAEKIIKNYLSRLDEVKTIFINYFPGGTISLILRVGLSRPQKLINGYNNVLFIMESPSEFEYFTTLFWHFDTSNEYLSENDIALLRATKGRPLKLKEWYKKLIKERESKSFW